MKYYSVRIVEAKDQDEAYDKICAEQFEERDALCDMILTGQELFVALKKRIGAH